MGTNPMTTAETDVVFAQEFAQILAELLAVDGVGHDENFFDDLGADSLLMAQFCSRVRKRPGLPKVSMKDIYGHSTVNALATALGAAPAAVVPAAFVAVLAPAPAPSGDHCWTCRRCSASTTDLSNRSPNTAWPPPRFSCRSPPRGRGCRTGSTTGGPLRPDPARGVDRPAVRGAAAGIVGFRWIAAGHGAAAEYLRTVGFLAAGVATLFVLPILAKWLLIGRWKPGEIRLWSAAYLRFWLVRSLIQRNPLLHLMMGSPLFGVYLRLLGAKVGPGAVILSRNIPVCTDLISIGAAPSSVRTWC